MDILTLPVNVATMMTTPAAVLTMMIGKMTKQASAFEDPKHCNTDGSPSCYNVGYNDCR